MNVFLVFVRDHNFCQLLPRELAGSGTADGRIKVMAFPPLGIQTLAPVVRQHGHQVRLFDTCHPADAGGTYRPGNRGRESRCHRPLLPLDDHLSGSQGFIQAV